MLKLMIYFSLGVSPNGKATASDAVTLGSNPGTPANLLPSCYC